MENLKEFQKVKKEQNLENEDQRNLPKIKLHQKICPKIRQENLAKNSAENSAKKSSKRFVQKFVKKIVKKYVKQFRNLK